MSGDFFFYWGHRALHSEKFYWIHKEHHESKNVVVMSSMAVHYIELLVVDAATFWGAIMMLGSHCHVVTAYTWMIFQLLSNVDDHSGYDFPWFCTKIFPWSVTNVFHNYHHLLNIGNFSAHMILWDSIFGTDISFLDHIDDQNAAKKDHSTITKIKRH